MYLFISMFVNITNNTYYMYVGNLSFLIVFPANKRRKENDNKYYPSQKCKNLNIKPIFDPVTYLCNQTEPFE